jgi:DNA-binding Lrp family transcriptional regulator
VVKAAELAPQVLDLRKQGYNYREIAERLGISVSTAHKHVTKMLAALREKTVEIADDVLRMELDRLDTMLAGVWTAATAGDTNAIDRVLKIMERRSKYLGLDAPEAVTLGVHTDQSTEVDLDKLSEAELLQLRQLQMKALKSADDSTQ